MPINSFFSSVAERYKEMGIGIILSGTASDGTAGMKAIKLAGGLTFAQDESAKFQSMPKSAVEQWTWCFHQKEWQMNLPK